jgi:hypothetical protein
MDEQGKTALLAQFEEGLQKEIREMSEQGVGAADIHFVLVFQTHYLMAQMMKQAENVAQ